MIKRALLIGIVCLSALKGFSQVSDDNREKLFAFEVKQIDEFIERFNDDSASFIREYIRTHYPTVTVDRATLVRNLFDQKKKTWDRAEQDTFFHQVLDSTNPAYLTFYSPDWFAEAFCSCTYEGKPVEAIVILKVSTDSSGGSKWIISDAWCKDIPVPDKISIPDAEDKGNKFLNPISHTTNFIGLSRALKDKQHIRDYLDMNFMTSARSQAFLKALTDGSLHYGYVKGIRYHFLNVDGWAFTVSYFQREEANSGWLISSLTRADEEQKEAYKTVYFK